MHLRDNFIKFVLNDNFNISRFRLIICVSKVNLELSHSFYLSLSLFRFSNHLSLRVSVFMLETLVFRVCVPVCACVPVRVGMFVCLFVCAYVLVRMCICVCFCVYVFVHGLWITIEAFVYMGVCLSGCVLVCDFVCVSECGRLCVCEIPKHQNTFKE